MVIYMFRNKFCTEMPIILAPGAKVNWATQDDVDYIRFLKKSLKFSFQDEGMYTIPNAGRVYTQDTDSDAPNKDAPNKWNNLHLS